MCVDTTSSVSPRNPLPPVHPRAHANRYLALACCAAPPPAAADEMDKFKSNAKAVAVAAGIVAALRRQIEEKGEEIRLLKESGNVSTRDLSTSVGELLKMKIRLAKMAGETVQTGQTPVKAPPSAKEKPLSSLGMTTHQGPTPSDEPNVIAHPRTRVCD